MNPEFLKVMRVRSPRARRHTPAERGTVLGPRTLGLGLPESACRYPGQGVVTQGAMLDLRLAANEPFEPARVPPLGGQAL